MASLSSGERFGMVSRGERCSRAVTRTHPASYSDPDLPVLIDLYDVVVSRSAVTVHCPDAASRVAIREVGGALTAKMLRSTAKGAPELRLEVVDAAMPDAGNVIAILLIVTIGLSGLCACIGWYARKQGGGSAPTGSERTPIAT